MTPPVILVAGAVSHDYLVYPMATSRHSRSGASPSANGEQAQVVVRTSDAGLVAKFLTAAAGSCFEAEILGPQLQSGGNDSLKSNASTLVDLDCSQQSLSKQPTFDVVRLRHVGNSPVWRSPSTDTLPPPGTSVVVISGSDDAVENIEPAIDFLARVRPQTIIHHMTRPLASGRLWDIIRNGPKTSNGVPDPDRLVVIVDADDLRAEGINLSRSLSWEATSEDFVRNLGSNGRLDTLVTCPNLVVRFGTEGVIHHRGRDAADPRLYFDPRRMEAERMTACGPMLGLTSAFTAGYAMGHNPENSVRLGICAARELEHTGFTMNPTDQAPDYPINQVMESLQLDTSFSVASIPSSKISSGDRWSLFDALTGDAAEVARQVVTLGPERALARCPVRRFGELLSIERAEQESLGAVANIVEERIDAQEDAPTCIGIFGPTGAGKKFTAQEMATHFGEGRSITKLTYDVRILKEDDFATACHAMRDCSATGSLPVVYFENSEMLLDSESDLLNQFLTLMGNGSFSDRGHTRHIGHAVLIFLVQKEATISDSVSTPIATEFSLRRRPTTQASNDFRDLRIEDPPIMDAFHGVIHIVGPNSLGSSDKTFPVRRAIMLRHMLLKKHPHLEINGVVNFDDAVLHALLLTPHFKHGLGSLDKIISASRLKNRTKFEIAALPPEEQIQLHVDGRIFMSFLRSPKLQPALRERLAQGLFETYKKQRVHMATTEADRRALESDRAFCDWEDLSPELKESTRAQADDIPRKLRSIGAFMLNDSGAEPRGEPLVHMPRFGDKDLLMLSEMEHERFNAERLQRQWRMGPRNSKQRTTPFLVPWRDLTQEWKDVDTVMVECVPGILEGAGWRIYKMQE